MNSKLTSMETAYRRIVDKLLTELPPPGTPLREEHLANEFSLSATPVREALRRLEQEGWVVTEPYRGCRTRSFSADEILDYFLLREAIEGTAAERFVQTASESELQNLKALINQEKQFLRQESPSRDFWQLDLEFHAAILQGSGSTLLSKHHHILRQQMSMLYAGGQVAAYEHLLEVHEEHSAIAVALLRGWSDAAGVLVRRHIANARKRFDYPE